MGKVSNFYRKQEVKKTYDQLVHHPLSKKVGDHNRIENWDYWWTGTVRNFKTKEEITYEQLLNKYII